jgi:hypothetical protein
MRIDGWDDALMKVIADHAARPYQAGVSDCFAMAMDGVGAVTGVRPYADVRYSTDLGAARQMKRRGFADLQEAVAAVLPPRDRAILHRGDVAVIPGTVGPTLGLVVAGGIAWKNSRLQVLPLSFATSFFAVD